MHTHSIFLGVNNRLSKKQSSLIKQNQQLHKDQYLCPKGSKRMVQFVKKTEIEERFRGYNTELCSVRLSRHAEVEEELQAGNTWDVQDTRMSIVYLWGWQDWSEQSKKHTSWSANGELKKIGLKAKRSAPFI